MSVPQCAAKSGNPHNRPFSLRVRLDHDTASTLGSQWTVLVIDISVDENTETARYETGKK
jgi:hypothetical protein